MTKTERKHLSTFIAEIEARGGETGINHAPSQGCAAKNTQWRKLEIVDTDRSEGRKVWLLRCEGWRYYSRRFGSRPAHLAYLCGYDDNGVWAARVPGTLTTALEAVDWLTPSEVKRARRTGRGVLRQGDVYAVETARRYDGAGLDYRTHIMPHPCELDWPSYLKPIFGSHAHIDSHEWYPRARVLIHSDSARSHSPMVVPFPARFVQQRAYQMGRGAGVGGAD